MNVGLDRTYNIVYVIYQFFVLLKHLFIREDSVIHLYELRCPGNYPGHLVNKGLCNLFWFEDFLSKVLVCLAAALNSLEFWSLIRAIASSNRWSSFRVCCLHFFRARVSTTSAGYTYLTSRLEITCSMMDGFVVP